MTAAPRAVPAADVVIVNWNAGRHLGECLRSIVRADRSQLGVARIVVVDNASTDSSLHALDTADIPLEVVRNTRNRGFAAACNQGASRGDSDLVLFLNPDTELYPDTLEALGPFLRTPPADSIGIFGGLMLDEHGNRQISCSRFPTLRVYLGKMTGLDRLAPALFPSHHIRGQDLTRSGPVDQVIGAFFLVRRQLFTELGGFDERYFLYLEDVDFALRARRAGWLSYYLQQVRVRHAGQVSSSQWGPWRHYLLLCSRSSYVFRHWTRPRAWALMALTLFLEPAARMAAAAVRGRWGELRATVPVYWQFMRWFCRSRRHRDADWRSPGPPYEGATHGHH